MGTRTAARYQSGGYFLPDVVGACGHVEVGGRRVPICPRTTCEVQKRSSSYQACDYSQRSASTATVSSASRVQFEVASTARSPEASLVWKRQRDYRRRRSDAHAEEPVTGMLRLL